MTESSPNTEAVFKLWSELIRSNTEQSIAQSVLLALLNVSNISAQFSGWLMAICGATIGLAFSNIESIRATMGASGIQFAFLFLIVSCFFGFAARIFSGYVQLYRTIISEVQSSLKEILQAHETELDKVKETSRGDLEVPPSFPDIKRAILLVLDCFPSIFRRRIERKIKKQSGQNPFSIYRRAVAFVFAQSAAEDECY
jgi:hypothetical protein